MYLDERHEVLSTLLSETACLYTRSCPCAHRWQCFRYSDSRRGEKDKPEIYYRNVIGPKTASSRVFSENLGETHHACHYHQMVKYFPVSDRWAIYNGCANPMGKLRIRHRPEAALTMKIPNSNLASDKSICIMVGPRGVQSRSRSDFFCRFVLPFQSVWQQRWPNNTMVRSHWSHFFVHSPVAAILGLPCSL